MMKAYLGSEGSHSHCVCELEGKLAAGVQRNGGSDGAVLLQVSKTCSTRPTHLWRSGAVPCARRLCCGMKRNSGAPRTRIRLFDEGAPELNEGEKRMNQRTGIGEAVSYAKHGTVTCLFQPP